MKVGNVINCLEMIKQQPGININYPQLIKANKTVEFLMELHT